MALNEGKMLRFLEPMASKIRPPFDLGEEEK